MSIILDTGFIVAHLNTRDSRHADVRPLMERVARREWGVPLVSEAVVHEIFILFRSRTRSASLEESARRFLPLPEPVLKGLRAVSLGVGGLPDTAGIFFKHRDQGISFTDANLLALMRSLGIEHLVTLDDTLVRLAPSAIPSP